MPTIHLLINQQNDYLAEYPLFFYNNREKFASNGVAIPWLECDRRCFIKQVNLSSHGQQLLGGRSDICEYFENMLAGREHLLLIGPVGELVDALLIIEFIKRRRLTGWENVTVHSLWVANARSLDVEGAFRRYPSPQNAAKLIASLNNNPEKWLGNLEKLLDSADTVAILPEPSNNHIDSAHLLDALNLPLDANIFKPVPNARLNSRKLLWLADRFASSGPERQRVAAALRTHDSSSLQPFMDASLLDSFDERHEKGIKKIVNKFGASMPVLRPFADYGKWKPFEEPNKEMERTLLATAFENTGKEGELTRYILDHTPQAGATSFAHISVSQSSKPLLSVLTLSKNHEKYIGQCIESVDMQKTDFPIQHIIVDDCSSDDTRRIIWEYAQKCPHIVPLFMSSWRPAGDNIRTLFESCKTDYAALCDGDDYFTDPFKLQKQIDFLRANPQCSICFHPVDVIYEDGSPSRVYPPANMLPGGEKTIYTLKDLLSGNLIQTNSVVYRWRFRDGLPSWFAANLVPGDWYWHILHAEMGAIGYLKEHMAVYRRHPASLYALADIGHTKHRAVHGMKELELYDTLDRHFKRKQQEAFFCFANDVFADFTRIYAQTGDDSALVEACERFPIFGKRFLSELKVK